MSDSSGTTDRLSRSEFMRELQRKREEALNEVEQAYKVMVEAKTRYERAVLDAHSVGCSNTSIAGRVDMTETAIRLYLKRRSA